MDDLHDVRLDGRKLVSDNPNKWLIPPTLVSADSLFRWWETLAEIDQQSHDSGLSRESRTLLLWLEAMYQQQVRLNTNTPADRSKVRSVLRHIVQQGLTISQTALLVGETPESVVKWLYCDKPISEHGIKQRLQAEKLMRRGVPLLEVMQETGLTRSEAQSLRKMLCLELPHATDKPLHLREQALMWRRDGFTNRQISDRFAQQGETVSPDTIAQWWHRYGKQAS